MHPLWRHSNSNWRNSSVSKWFQRSQNFTSFVGTFMFQLIKRTVEYWKDFKDDRTMHSLWRHSNSNWKISSVSKWFQRLQNFTSFVGTFKSELKNTIHYWNDCKDDRTLHSLLGHSNSNRQNLTFLLGHSNSNWKKQFSIQVISKMTEPYIFSWDIQIPTEKGSLVSKWFQR